MKKKRIVITYGTYDMFHVGHLNLLKRAKGLGDYLIVGVTSESYDRSRGKLNVVQSLETRLKAIKKLSFVDEVIVEDHKNQKPQDIKKYNADIFVLGDDWLGKFDYLNEFCEVVYLPRTKGISSTILREEIEPLKLGIIGTGRISKRFIKEITYVDKIEAFSILSSTMNRAEEFIKDNGILYGFDDIELFLDSGIDAVYIASEHEKHYEQCKKALLANKHVLCEKPISLDQSELKELTELSKEKNLVFMEGIKTAYSPCFIKMLEELKSGIIGEIKEVRSTFTKIVEDKSLREWSSFNGGATNELGSYTELISQKILGKPISQEFLVDSENEVDSSNIIISKYANNKISISTVSIGRKSEGCAIVSGTKGYIYIPAPWWLTKEFYIRFEDPNKELVYKYEFQGDGLRYEISEFVSCISRGQNQSNLLNHEEMLNINKTISSFNLR